MADYTERPLSFQIKKALRYTRMYGVRRTLNIIRGQYHMKRAYETLPAIRPSSASGKHVGVIGCGTFGFGVVGYFLNKNYGKVIRGALDHNANRAASFYRHYGLDYYTTDPEELLGDPAIDLVYIASNHASHAEYAVRALECGKAVHIEKPHVVDESQLRRLCATMMRTGGKVRLGFNRPRSPHGRLIKHYLDAQTGTAMLNWFVAGAPLPRDHWYFKPEEGGRVLGNLCHWTDFTFQMAPPEKRFPIVIQPTKFDRPDENVAVTFLFGDGSIGAITYSAKGQPFEGDKERFTAHRNECLIALEDFHRMVVEVEDRKRIIAPFFRDHGHDANVRESYEMVCPATEPNPGCDVAYVWETGLLFLKTKQALDKGEVVTIERGFDESCLGEHGREGQAPYSA
jgi:predicted dehydrogenase